MQSLNHNKHSLQTSARLLDTKPNFMAKKISPRTSFEMTTSYFSPWSVLSPQHF